MRIIKHWKEENRQADMMNHRGLSGGREMLLLSGNSKVGDGCIRRENW